MYRRILVPLEHSATDTAILEHVARLAPILRGVDRADPRGRRLGRAQHQAARRCANRRRCGRTASTWSGSPRSSSASGLGGGGAARQRRPRQGDRRRRRARALRPDRDGTHGHRFLATCSTAAWPTRCGTGRWFRCCWCAGSQDAEYGAVSGVRKSVAGKTVARKTAVRRTPSASRTCAVGRAPPGAAGAAVAARRGLPQGDL